METTISSALQTAVSKIFNDELISLKNEEIEKEVIEGKIEVAFVGMLKSVSHEMVIKLPAIIITRPLHVLAVRQICSIIDGTSQSIPSIIEESGWSALFAGLGARLAYEVVDSFLNNLLDMLVMRYCHQQQMEKQEIRKYSKNIIEMAVNTVTYPLSLISTIMIINGSGMSLDFKLENSISVIYSYLKARNQTANGNAIFFRRKALSFVETAL